MSENEKKDNQQNQDQGKSSAPHKNHHKRHRRRGGKPNNQKSNERVTTAEAQAPSQNQNQNHNQNQKKNHGQDQKNNRPKDRDNRNDRKGNQQKDKQTRPETIPSFLDTAPTDDSIFGGITLNQPSRTPAKKPESVPVEPIVYRTLSNEELFGTSHIVYTPPVPEKPTVEIVGVRFKASGKTYYFSPNGMTFKKGDLVIVETARGMEFGEIFISNRLISEKDIVPPLQKVCRLAKKDDIDRNAMNKEKEKEAFKLCLDKIKDHGLDMDLIDVQCAFDNSKLLFYFTSAGRVDFRELVRDLASLFKTRIELRQIGIRDEAKLIGGIGICGRALCCTRYLSNFAQVSIKMAKDQGLSLSSNKISGNCGRLMCCLNFENQTYVDEIKRTPMPGSLVKLDGKVGSVTDANPLSGMIKVKFTKENDAEIISTHRDNVVLIPKKTPEGQNDGEKSE